MIHGFKNSKAMYYLGPGSLKHFPMNVHHSLKTIITICYFKTINYNIV